MREIRSPLLPPVTPPGLPRGLQRGGVLSADWVPATYIDASRPTVPTDSPRGHDVAQDVFRAPVAFTHADQVRVVTGPPGVSGYGQFVEAVGPPPIGIPGYHAPRLPHGATKGGIFGPGPIRNGAPLPYVPMARPGMREIIEASSGYGVGPDGLGGIFGP